MSDKKDFVSKYLMTEAKSNKLRRHSKHKKDFIYIQEGSRHNIIHILYVNHHLDDLHPSFFLMMFFFKLILYLKVERTILDFYSEANSSKKIDRKP